MNFTSIVLTAYSFNLLKYWYLLTVADISLSWTFVFVAK